MSDMDLDMMPLPMRSAGPRQWRPHSVPSTPHHKRTRSMSSGSGSPQSSPVQSGRKFESPAKRSRAPSLWPPHADAAPTKPSFVSDPGLSLRFSPFDEIECVVPGENVVRRLSMADLLQPGSDKLTVFILTFYGGQFAVSTGLDGPSHLFAVSSAYKSLESLDCRVYGVSLDSSHTHLRWLSSLPEGAVEFPLLSDTHRKITSSLGMYHPMAAGQTCLDAVVVLDRFFRRRVVLPCHIMRGEGGANEMVAALHEAVTYLHREPL